MRRSLSVAAVIAVGIMALSGCTDSSEQARNDEQSLIAFGMDSVPSTFNAKAALDGPTVEKAQERYLKVTDQFVAAITKRFAALEFKVSTKADKSPLTSINGEETMVFSITTETYSADWPSLDEGTLRDIIDVANATAIENEHEAFDAEVAGYPPITQSKDGSYSLTISGKVKGSDSAYWNVSAFFGLDSEGAPYGSVLVNTTSAPHLAAGTEDKFRDLVKDEYSDLIEARPE